MHNYYDVLGLPNEADSQALENRINNLRKSLAPGSFAADSQEARQAQTCLERCERAFRVLSNPELRAQHDEKLKHSADSPASTTKPRLGQLCVASGMISMAQLEEAVETQLATNSPLGEVLEDKHFISRVELEGLLLGQDLIDVPSVCTDPLGQRLIALGIVSEDMILIAQMEMKAQAVSLVEIISRRGWASKALLAAIQ